MSKRTILIIVVIVLFGLFAFFVLRPSDGIDYEFDMVHDVVPQDEGIYSMPFVSQQEQIASTLDWELWPVNEDDSEHLVTDTTWSKIKNSQIGLYGMAAGFGDNVNMFINAPIELDDTKTWNELIINRGTEIMFIYPADSDAAINMFGKKITKNPVSAIQKACGKPTGRIEDILVYNLGEYSFTFVPGTDEETGETIITITQTIN